MYITFTSISLFQHSGLTKDEGDGMHTQEKTKRLPDGMEIYTVIDDKVAKQLCMQWRSQVQKPMGYTRNLIQNTLG